VIFDDDSEGAQRLVALRQHNRVLAEAAEAKASALEDGSEVGRLKAVLVRALDYRRQAKLLAQVYHDHDEHEHEAVELIKAARHDNTIAEAMQKLDELGIRVKFSRVADDAEGTRPNKDAN